MNRFTPAARKRLVVSLLVLGGLAFVVLGISRISFKVDPLKLLPGTLEEVQGLDLYLQHFSRPNELIIAVSGSEAEAVSEASASLAATLRNSDHISVVHDRAPWEEDPAGLAELVALALINLPPEKFETMRGELTASRSGERIQDSLEQLTYSVAPEALATRAYDPLGLIEFAMGKGAESMSLLEGDLAGFSSPDGTLRLIYAKGIGHDDRADYQDLIDWTTALRGVVEEWQEAEPLAGQVDVQFTGEPAFVADISSAMRGDMRKSGLMTLVLIGGVFWLWYRKVQPLFALVTTLLIIFVATLGTAGWVIRNLTVINVGFASILIGLCVDYGVLIYHSSLRHPGKGQLVRRENQRGILYAGATTASAFLAMGVSSMPGLSELGILVGIGIAVGALVMLTLFVYRMRRISTGWSSKPDEEAATPLENWLFAPQVVKVTSWVVVGMLVVAALVLAVKGLPEMDKSDRNLRPRVSEAYDALDLITHRMLEGKEVGNLVVRGDTPKEVLEAMEQLRPGLKAAKDEGRLQSFFLPTAFIPVPEYQQANLESTAWLTQQTSRLSKEIYDAGFSEDASALIRQTFGVLELWTQRENFGAVQLPEGETALWMLERMLTFPIGEEFVAAGLLQVTPGANVRDVANGEQAYLAEWRQTMEALHETIPSEFLRIFAVLVSVVALLLFLAFKRLTEVLWVFLSITLSLTAILGMMSLFGWTWNFFNMATLLLTFGAGLDYSVHMLLGFRRQGNRTEWVQRNVGQALLVCALSTVAGFGSLMFASNRGLASLGQMCALGLFLNALVAVFLLPRLWQWFGPKPEPASRETT